MRMMSLRPGLPSSAAINRLHYNINALFPTILFSQDLAEEGGRERFWGRREFARTVFACRRVRLISQMPAPATYRAEERKLLLFCGVFIATAPGDYYKLSLSMYMHTLCRDRELRNIKGLMK